MGCVLDNSDILICFNTTVFILWRSSVSKHRTLPWKVWTITSTSLSETSLLCLFKHKGLIWTIITTQIFNHDCMQLCLHWDQIISAFSIYWNKKRKFKWISVHGQGTVRFSLQLCLLKCMLKQSCENKCHSNNNGVTCAVLQWRGFLTSKLILSVISFFIFLTFDTPPLIALTLKENMNFYCVNSVRLSANSAFRIDCK